MILGHSMTVVGDANMIKHLFVIFILTLSYHSLASDLMDRLSHYCSANLSEKEFLSKNEIVVSLYSRTSYQGQYIILDSVKGLYPVNYPVYIRDTNNKSMVDPGNTILTEIYWGVPKLPEDFSTVIVDPNNCLIKKKEQDIYSEMMIIEDWSDLDKATSSYDFQKAEKLIQEKKFKNNKGEYSWNSFAKLAHHRNDLALAMLDQGFPLEDDKHNSAIMDAIMASNLMLAEKAISLKGNVNYTYPYNGITALHLAVMTANLPMVKLLLKSGAKVQPHPPFNHNSLCYIGGMDKSTGKNLVSQVENSKEIAAALLKAGADPNASCNVKTPKGPLSFIDKNEFTEVIQLFIDHGLKLDPKDSYMGMDGQIRLLLGKIGLKLDSYTKASLDEFQQQKRQKLPLDNQEQLARIMKNAIAFDDFDLFSRVIEHLSLPAILTIHPPVKKFSDQCISQLIADADAKYYTSLQKKGLKISVNCSEGEYVSSVIENFLAYCRYELIEKIPEEELKQILIDKDKISNFFRETLYTIPDYQYRCMKTLSTLAKRKIPFEKQYALRRILEAKSTSLLDFALIENIFEPVILLEALKAYQNDAHLMPIENDQNSLSVSRAKRNYFTYVVTPLIADFNSAPSIKLNQKKRYPVCSLQGEASAYKRKIEPYPKFFIPDCQKLTSDNLVYYELYEEKDGFLALIAINEISDDDSPIMGSKYYVRPDNITTPFYLTDDKYKLPLSLGGLSKVVIQNGQYSEVGTEDICKRTKSPVIISGEVSGDIINLPVDFNVSKAKILSNLPQDDQHICPSKAP